MEKFDEIVYLLKYEVSIFVTILAKRVHSGKFWLYEIFLNVPSLFDESYLGLVIKN